MIIFSAFAIAALIGLSSAAHAERASMPRSIQVSRKIAVSDIVSDSTVGSDYQSFSSLWTDQDDARKMKGKVERCEGREESFIGQYSIRLLEAKNWLLRAEKDGSKSVLEKNAIKFIKKEKERKYWLSLSLARFKLEVFLKFFQTFKSFV